MKITRCIAPLVFGAIVSLAGCSSSEDKEAQVVNANLDAQSLGVGCAFIRGGAMHHVA